MEIKDMINLYIEEGITATDVLTLNKAGYTPDIIKELKENGLQSNEVKQQAKEQQQENQQQQQELQQAKEETNTLTEQLNNAQKEIADLKKMIESIQADNRGKDMEGDLPDPEEYKKNLSDYISSKM